MVYSVLLIVVLGIIGALFISMSRTETTVRNVVGAGNQGQVTADSIENGIRNASAYVVSSPTATTQLLMARVAQGGAAITWKCEAWLFDSTNGGSIRFYGSDAAITAPSTTTAATWTLLASNVVPVTGTTIFAANGDTLSIAFITVAGTDPSVTIQTTAERRAGLWGSGTCF
jgi:hypothetical protein